MTEHKSGWIRRTFATFWRLLDGSRRLFFNLLFVLLLLGLVVAWWGSTPAKLKERTILVINLAGPIVEQRAVSARAQALDQVRGGSGRAEAVQLRDVLRALDVAASDPQITGALLLLDDFGGAGLPTLHEVAAALQRLRASGKKVTAWAAHYDQRAYYLAAHADEVLMHPMGMVYLDGYGSLRNYYRDAFDRLGVTAHVIRAGRFKNFGEGYVANAPSAETLAADKSLYDALWANYTVAVEAARKLPAGTLAKGIDNLPQALAAAGNDPARMALDARLVDGLKTRDELRALMIERGARDAAAKSFRQVDLTGLLARHKPKTSGDAIGVVVAEGSISEGQAPAGQIGGRSTAELIRQAREDDSVKAVLLRVRSPGGSAFGSELIRRELELTRAAGKPVVVSMGDVAASGGYWIATAADEVIADAATITGSIGVFALLPTAEGLMGKLSLHTGGYATTWLTHAFDPRKALDPRFEALTQRSIDQTYERFKSLVAAARKTTPDQIDAVAQGRVWTGAQALDHGLVDRTGSFGDAVAAAARRAKLAPDARLAWIERPPGRLNRLLALLGAQGLVDALEQSGLDALSSALQAIWDSAGPAAWLAAQAQGPGQLGAALVGAGPRTGTAAQDIAWLAQLLEQRTPYAANAHCLCSQP